VPNEGVAGGTHGPSRLAGGIDLFSDWAVLAYAAWTLIVYLGIVAHFELDALFIAWLVATPFALAILIRLRVEPPGARQGVERHESPFIADGRTKRLALAALGVGGLSALLGSGLVGDYAWPFVWLPGVVAAGAAVVAGCLRSRAVVPEWHGSGRLSDLGVTGVGLVFAAMSLFIDRMNWDDAFYVNRATASAKLNRIPVRDVLFTHEQVAPTVGSGLPVDAFPPFEGAIARFLGIEAPSVAYYLVPPVATFLATWALWRLIRSWAGRAALTCFALGALYWILSAQFPLTPGSYFLGRIWQGKVIFVAWIVPTAYVYFTRWLDKRDARTGLLLFATAVSSIGLTSSATFAAPLLFSTVGLVLCIRRDWRGLPMIAAAGAFPLVVGGIATLKYPFGDVSFGQSLPPSFYYSAVFGTGVLAVISGFALWTAPWVTRSGPPRAMVAGIAIVTLLILTPGLLTLIGGTTHVSTTLRRTLWIVPLPALVALLAALPPGELVTRLAPRLRQVAGVLPALLVSLALILSAHPVWIRAGHSAWVDKPKWKFPAKNLAQGRAILARYNGSGPILAEEFTMTAIALLTVEPKAVDARHWYARLTPEPGERTELRIALTNFANPKGPKPSMQRVRRGLAELRVGLVCLPVSEQAKLEEVKRLGPYEDAFRAVNLACVRRV
jgi:hypothetical protein